MMHRPRLLALSMLPLLAGVPWGAAAQSAPGGQAAAAEARDRNLTAYVALLRADVRAQKVAVITEVMAFTEEEDRAFWPIYRAYDLELTTLNDERVRLIEKYASNYQSLTDATADEIASGALDIEGRRHALKQKYYAQLKGALSPKTAARFLQVENQLLLLIDLQIAAALPLAQ